MLGELLARQTANSTKPKILSEPEKEISPVKSVFDDLSLASSAQSDASTYNDEGIRLLPQVPHFDISDVQCDKAFQTDAFFSQAVDKAVQAGVQPLLVDSAS